MDISNISKKDLNKLHTLILTIIKMNKIDLFSLGKLEEGKISLLTYDNLWYIFDMHGNDYIVQNLEFACTIIIRTLSKSLEEEHSNFSYFYKLLLLNIPTSELIEYINFHTNKDEKKKYLWYKVYIRLFIFNK